MKRILTFMAAVLLSIISIAQTPAVPQPKGVSKVDADVLLLYMRDSLGCNIFFVRDTSDKKSYTVYGEGEEFIKEAFSQLTGSNYTIAEYDGKILVYKGRDIVRDLPVGYFEKAISSKDESTLARDETSRQATFQNKIYEIGEKAFAKSGKSTVRGYVRDAASGEPLAGVSLYTDQGAYTITDAFGFYKIMLPSGESSLGFSGYSLEDMKFQLMVYGDGSFDVAMKEKIFTLTGAVVSAESTARHRSTQMGIETVRIAAVKNVPVAFGESDVLKVVMTLPGVKSVGEVSNGFNVRGGSTDQNLILFNGGTIYNPSHMFGLLSAFNSDVISDVELYKSSIPVEYGGRISSVLDIRSRDGNSKKVTGSLSLGLLTSHAHIEGPLGKEGRTTFILGGRTTYSNWIFGLLPPGSSYSGGKASFQDLNMGVTHRLDENNSIHAYGYLSRDKFGFGKDTTFHYNNIDASVRWRSNFSDRHSMILTMGYDNYKYTVDDTFNEEAAYSLGTGISQEYLRLTFKSILSDNHTLTYGVSGILYDLNRGTYLPCGSASIVTPKTISPDKAIESAAYVSDQWKVTDKLTIDAGLRYSNFNAFGAASKMYQAPEYRLSGKYSFSDKLTLKAGINTMNQYVHKISNCVNISPNDTWKLSDADIKPQQGWQAATGLYATVNEGKIDLSAELYYKQVKNFVDYRNGAILEMNENLSEDLLGTYCRAYGVELMAKKSVGQLNGWVSYTYSRARLREMEDHGLVTVNNGDRYNASYDKPHDFKMVANYKFTHRYSFSANMDYSTGRPVTLPLGKYYYSGEYRLFYSERNSYRIPDYFRLDVAMNIEPSHYLKQFAHMSVTFGVYNITGRKNPYSIYYTSEGTTVSGHMLCIFASPIPYVSLNMKLR